MGTIIEVKYYNSFWAKKAESITSIDTITATASAASTSTTISVDDASSLKIGMLVTNTSTSFIRSNVYIVSINGNNVEVNKEVTVALNDSLDFGPFVNFDEFPKQFTKDDSAINKDWYIEESRIRGGYNNTTVDFGVKAYAVDEVKQGETRKNALIYSGIYNSRTGINSTNQFSVGEDITKAVDPAYGPIQLLYAEDSNLIVFQEDKVSRALIDKDAIYSAEGGGTVTSSNLVIGQIVPYAGEYGISTNPESFAVYGYRKYFADRKRNAVLRLSRDGIEEISRYGMTDFFRDNLSILGPSGKIVGGYDIHTKKYDLSILPSGQFRSLTAANELNEDNPYKTLSFDESTKGWTSFYTYAPDYIDSLGSTFYSFKRGYLWKHYSDTANRSTFYDYYQSPSVEFVFNPNVSMSKVFKTINYEGSDSWKAQITTDSDIEEKLLGIRPYAFVSTLQGISDNFIASNIFIKKENKYFANILNAQPAKPGEIIFGAQMTGLKGFVASVVFSTDATTDKKLFAVSTEYVQSSY